MQVQPLRRPLPCVHAQREYAPQWRLPCCYLSAQAASSVVANQMNQVNVAPVQMVEPLKRATPIVEPGQALRVTVSWLKVLWLKVSQQRARLRILVVLAPGEYVLESQKIGYSQKMGLANVE
jgi:hypothetical protein